MHEDIEEVLYSEEQLARRVGELGAAITADYADAIRCGEKLVVVCVLRGAAIFAADLVRAIDLPLEMDYMAVSSYGNAAVSSGKIRILKDLATDVAGRHILVVEDILDSGLTLKSLREELLSRGAASVRIAALLRKERPDQIDVDCAYVGFETPDAFIVGYGLDYAEGYRNIPYIGILKPAIYQ